MRIVSYCKIGVACGGTLPATVSYLNRFAPIERVLAVDDNSMGSLETADRLWKELGIPVEIVCAGSNSAVARDAVYRHKPDLTMIDADHSEEMCRADYCLASSYSNWTAMHDIVEHSTPGVAKVWRAIDNPTKMEFVDQYPDMKESFFGIGLVHR